MSDQITNLPIQQPGDSGQAPLDPIAPSPQPPAKRSHGFGWLLAACIGLLIVIVAALLVHGHGSKTTPASTVAPVSPTAVVSIDGEGFTPTTLNINANTTVTWTVKDASLHIVASNTYPKDDILPGLKSQQLGENAQYSYSFKKPGTYPYHDDLHPDVNGTIVVK